MGKVPHKILAAFDIKKEIYYAEFDADALLRLSKNTIKFMSLPKFPSVKRDLALVIDHRISFEEIRKLAIKEDRFFVKRGQLI
jgi:phenylalanyl-tRNA synthetase beta chain